MKLSVSSKTRGFSLIEVIVAMGIASTVMVGLIGIMPAGVESLHDASTTTIQARIVQDLISDAQMATWEEKSTSSNSSTKGLTEESRLSDLAGPNHSRKYDSDGNLITTGAGASTPVSYVTLLELPTGTNEVPTILSTPYKHLKKVQISVEFTPGGRAPDFKSESHSRFVRRYSFYLANMGTSEGLN